MKTFATVSPILLALVACASNQASSPLPFFPQVAPQPPGLDEVWLLAAYRGEVIVENGCVKLRSPDGTLSTTVLWYQGVELDRDESGLLLRGPGGSITRFNTLSEFGGGEASPEYVERDYPEVARRCGPPYAYGYPANVYDAP
jgi:hypothetical protein